MKNVIYIFIIFILTSCSFTSLKTVEKKKPSLSFDHDVNVIVDGKKVPFKANQKVELTSNKAVMAQAKGRVSMLIYPLNTSENDLKIKLPNLDSSQITEAQNLQTNKKLDSILHEVQQVQIMMLNQDYTNALSKIRDLKTQHPGVAFLSFIEGSCYSVLNQRTEALRAIREGLEIYPESADAKELYKKLSGENF